jgi:hypothetical protein
MHSSLTVANESDISALKKMRAQFELRPLVVNGFNVDDLPPTAVESSTLALNVFQTFFTEVEDKRNESE